MAHEYAALTHQRDGGARDVPGPKCRQAGSAARVPSRWRETARLIGLGTGKLSPGDAFGKLGYRRKSEGVLGPMPPFGEIVRTDDDLWKIIAWIRSVYCGRRPDILTQNVTRRDFLNSLALAVAELTW
jgi:hypothetical protein